MAGGDTSTAVGENSIQTPLRLVEEIGLIFSFLRFSGSFKKDCNDLARKLSLLTHLFEEIRDFRGDVVGASSTSNSCIFDLSLSLKAAKELLFVANKFDPNISSDGAVKKKKIVFQFQCVTWKLEKALANLPYDHFEISEEVQEQVGLVRSQLKRASDRYGGPPLNSKVVSTALSQLLEKDIDLLQQEGNESIWNHLLPNVGNVNRMSDSLGVPEDFLCPISQELMRDPVILSTGQTYERSYIQKWFDLGYQNCPKTTQKLKHFTLTPNYVLKNIIDEWYVKKHNEEEEEEQALLRNEKIKNSDAVVVSEIRSLSNRILINAEEAEAGGGEGLIPTLVNNLLTSILDDDNNKNKGFIIKFVMP